MRFYNQQHGFYCGVDLHARMLAVCILDEHGRIAYWPWVIEDYSGYTIPGEDETE